MRKTALSSFKVPSLRGRVERDPQIVPNMTYNFFFLASKTLLTVSEVDPANSYENQTQINWLNWDLKPPGALPKKAPPLCKQLIAPALQKVKPL